MSFVKYRLKEVAQDFGVSAKDIAEIVAKFSEKPKSNTQVLTDVELNCVFDYLTQQNQISDLSVVFAAAAPKAEPVKESPKAEAKPQQNNRPQQQNNPQRNPAPQQKPQQAQQPQKSAEPERKRERRVVDTSAVQLNTNRFADVDNLVSERVQDFKGGKQKFGKKGQQQNKKENKFKGNKARNE